MPETPSQDNRRAKLKTPLGPDALLLQGFSGNEGINRLSEFSVDAVALNPPDFESILGLTCSVEVETDAGPRHFTGTLTEATALGIRNGLYTYRLVLRSWLWLLSRRRNQAIFHEKNVQQILTAILSPYGHDFEFDLSKTYPELEYTVQYGETDLDFARRMMERFGINFHFQDGEMTQKAIFSDSADTFPEIAGGGRDFVPPGGTHSSGERFSEWSHDRRIATDSVRLTDYNFKTSRASMTVNAAGKDSYLDGALQSFDYPGQYLDEGAGGDVAKLNIRQEQFADRHHWAEGDAVSVAPGVKVKLRKHPDPALNAGYIALSCTHSFVEESYFGGGGSIRSGEASYLGRAELIEDSRPVVPERVTPRAMIHGPQVALVSGKGEIDCDEYGRILVQFPWDLDKALTMRCRVAQGWAGSSWGAIMTPRVGMEAVVVFENGDPDRPLVVGCVYNDANMPPYDMTGEDKSITGVKSKSVEAKGYNEFVFDDKAGEELIRTHAQKNMETTVLNDRTTTIDHDDTQHVGNELKVDAKTKMTLTVGGCEIMMDGTQIKLSIGSSSITMNASSIATKGLTLDMNATAELKTNGGGTASHKAGGLLEVQAGLVKIN